MRAALKARGRRAESCVRASESSLLVSLLSSRRQKSAEGACVLMCFWGCGLCAYLCFCSDFFSKAVGCQGLFRWHVCCRYLGCQQFVLPAHVCVCVCLVCPHFLPLVFAGGRASASKNTYGADARLAVTGELSLRSGQKSSSFNEASQTHHFTHSHAMHLWCWVNKHIIVQQVMHSRCAAFAFPLPPLCILYRQGPSLRNQTTTLRLFTDSNHGLGGILYFTVHAVQRRPLSDFTSGVLTHRTSVFVCKVDEANAVSRLSFISRLSKIQIPFFRKVTLSVFPFF